MACFFIVDTYIDEAKGRGSYDDYIEAMVENTLPGQRKLQLFLHFVNRIG